MKRAVSRPFAAGLFTIATILSMPVIALADDNDEDHRLRADPFVFVGRAGDCGELRPGVAYPAGSQIVTAAWLGGAGLPAASEAA